MVADWLRNCKRVHHCCGGKCMDHQHPVLCYRHCVDGHIFHCHCQLVSMVLGIQDLSLQIRSWLLVLR